MSSRVWMILLTASLLLSGTALAEDDGSQRTL